MNPLSQKNAIILTTAVIIILGVVGVWVYQNYQIQISRPLAADLSPAPAANYDVVVVGAGTGGFGAAVQAARMGSRVALLEVTDMVGGQMTASAVSTMDGPFYINDVLGIYTEFINRVKQYYSDTKRFPPSGKSVSTCYNAASGVCFEPNVGRQILTTMLQEAGVTLMLRTRVTGVTKSGNAVTGVVTNKGTFGAKVVIDATEYGDVIPLTGARYRIGNTTSSNINSAGIDPNKPGACLQDITYTAVIKKYPKDTLVGPLASLIMKNPPPGYDAEVKRLRGMLLLTGGSWTGVVPANFGWFLGYRGMPDSSNPVSYTGAQSWLITKTGVNWSNDYPLSTGKGSWGDTLPISYIENPAVRKDLNCKAKLNTLQFIYYVQKEVGASTDGSVWSIDNSGGYGVSPSSYNVEENSCANIPAEFKAIEYNMPVMPYVRESRRIVPITTARAAQTVRSGSPPKSITNFATAVAVGDYGNDAWHNCYQDSTLEADLGETIKDAGGSGVYQIPFETLIPETIDGFLAAEKNIGGTRLFNAAVRTQPTTMAVGQAAGALASLAAKNGIQPRAVQPISVQRALVDSKSSISLYQFNDVPLSNPRWSAVQLDSVSGLMTGLSTTNFGINDAFPRWQMAIVLTRALKLSLDNLPATPTFTDVPTSHPQYKYIEAIYKAGLTTGCANNPRRFCPSDSITRAGFMTALSRAYKPASVPTTPVFKDVPVTYGAFQIVQSMASLGLAVPCKPDYFCPDAVMNRGDAASFLAQTLFVNAGPLPTPIPTPISTPTPTPTPTPTISIVPTPTLTPVPLSGTINHIVITPSGLTGITGTVSPSARIVKIIIRQGPDGATNSATNPDWDGSQFVGTRTELDAYLNTNLAWDYPIAALNNKLQRGSTYTVYINVYDNVDVTKAQSTKWGVIRSSFVYTP